MRQTIDKAVIPAAGFGSRLLPLTKSIPKELLSVGKLPMIQYSIEELVNSNISKVCLVIRKEKEAIKEYLTLEDSFPFRDHIAIKRLEEIINKITINFVYQPKPKGLANALLEAKDFADCEPFVLIFPDQLLISEIPATRQLLERYQINPGATFSSMVEIPKTECLYFKGSCGFKYKKSKYSPLVEIEDFNSEEEIPDSYKNLDYEIRGFGRSILQPAIFDCIRNFQDSDANHSNRRYRLALKEAVKSRPHLGIKLKGLALDFGTIDGYSYYNEILRKSNLLRE